MKKRGKTTPELELRDFLPSRLALLSEHVSRGLARIYSERFDLTNPEWRVLAWLSQDKSLRASEISKLANLDRATLSRAVGRLVEKGLLKRAQGAEDQRVQRLSLTRKAERLLEQLLPLAFEWEQRLLSTLSQSEARTLRRVLGKLEERLSAIEAEEDEAASAARM